MENQAEAGGVKEIMTVPELAHYLRLSKAKVYRLAKTGLVPAFRIGKSWRFKKEAVDEWIRLEIGQSFFNPVDPPPVIALKPVEKPI